jgi:glucoamylase
MPRDLPVGNGKLLVNFDSKYQIRDIYFPHPGLTNHSEGATFRFGIWVNGTFSWLSSDDWTRQMRYQHETLVTDVRLRCEKLGIEIQSNDAVDFYENVFVRKLTIKNLQEHLVEVRVFFHQDFRLGGTEPSDTAYYDPSTRAIIHYEGRRYFLVGSHNGTDTFDQWAIGNKDFRGAEGTWRDAEDGNLQGNPIAQGSVDSTVGVTIKLEPSIESRVYYWIAAGRSHNDVRIIDQVVRSKSPEVIMRRTGDYWRAWVNKEEMNFAELPLEVVDAFKRSLLIIRTNIDDNGAITAANDADVIAYNRDTYSYVWPRDAALTAYALDISGFSELTRRFYIFARNLITPDGYFLHKYTPEGAAGSSWLPWINEGDVQLPIQEDETSLMIWGLWKHYKSHRDLEFIAEFYAPVIKKAADFMASYRDERTSLPHPSWDLWEERHGVHAFTVATVWAGLQAAARFAALFGESQLSERYLQVSAEIKQAALRYLYSRDLGRFVRTIKLPRQLSAQTTAKELETSLQYDATVDSSLFGLWYFGMLDAQAPEVRATMDAVREALWSRSDAGGLARYEHDSYYRSSKNEGATGNPWFTCTLWLAQYDIATAKDAADLAPALETIRWAIRHGLESGVLAEQVDSETGVPLSVSPLTWSHAQLVTAIVEYLEKLRENKLCETCGQPAFDYIRRNTSALRTRVKDLQGK